MILSRRWIGRCRGCRFPELFLEIFITCGWLAEPVDVGAKAFGRGFPGYGVEKRRREVVHGRNDVRVPLAEAEQIVKAVRANNVPVWNLVGEDEGHVFSKRVNLDYVAFTTILFLKERFGLDAAQ